MLFSANKSCKLCGFQRSVKYNKKKIFLLNLSIQFKLSGKAILNKLKDNKTK